MFILFGYPVSAKVTEIDRYICDERELWELKPKESLKLWRRFEMYSFRWYPLEDLRLHKHKKQQLTVLSVTFCLEAQVR